jgi:TRAP-type mannitol/chloroaromatic compound transport system permease small subunit
LKLLLAISNAIDWLTERVGGIMAVIVVLTIIIGFANAFLRKLSGAIGQTLITNQLIQAQWYLFSLLFLLGFPYILKHNVNVRVDFLYAKWGPRRRALVDFVGTLLFLIIFCVIGLYTAWGPVLTSFGRLPDGSFSGEWEVSGDAGGLTIAPLKAFILVGFALMLLQAFSQLIKYLTILSGIHDEKLEEAVMKAETDQAMAEEMAEQLKAEGKIN